MVREKSVREETKARCSFLGLLFSSLSFFLCSVYILTLSHTLSETVHYKLQISVIFTVNDLIPA